MYTGFFDVLHDARHQHALAIAQRVDIYFGGIFQKTIDQYRALHRKTRRLVHIVPHSVFVVRDNHGAAT